MLRRGYNILTYSFIHDGGFSTGELPSFQFVPRNIFGWYLGHGMVYRFETTVRI